MSMDNISAIADSLETENSGNRGQHFEPYLIKVDRDAKRCPSEIVTLLLIIQQLTADMSGSYG